MLLDGDVNSGVGRDWYGGTSQARDSVNYKKLLQAQRSVVFFKVRSVLLSVFVTLYLGMEGLFIILEVSCVDSSAIPISNSTTIHITVLEKKIRKMRNFEIKKNS